MFTSVSNYYEEEVKIELLTKNELKIRKNNKKLKDMSSTTIEGSNYQTQIELGLQ